MRTGQNAQTAPKMSSLFGLKLKLVLTKIKIQHHKHTSAADITESVKPAVDCVDWQHLCLQDRKQNYMKENSDFGNTSSPVNIHMNCIESI